MATTKKAKKETKKVSLVDNTTEQSQVEAVNESQENVSEADQPRLSPDMVNTTDMAIRVLISAADAAFKAGIFNKDMNDVECIGKSIRICGEYINTEIFKIRHYNKTLVESIVDEKVHTEVIELDYKATKTEGIKVAAIPVMEGKTFFMFLNGEAIILTPEDKVYDVFGKLVPSVTK